MNLYFTINMYSYIFPNPPPPPSPKHHTSLLAIRSLYTSSTDRFEIPSFIIFIYSENLIFGLKYSFDVIYKFGGDIGHA